MKAKTKQYIYIAIGGALVLAYIIYNERQNLVSNFFDLSFNSSNATPTSGGAYNNPLNMKQSGDAWIGLVTSPSTVFCSFDTLAHGFRAPLISMRNAYKNSEIVTLSDLINRWAPASDNNNPASYTNTVSQATGIAPSQDVGNILNDQSQTTSLLLSMANVEQGAGFTAQAGVTDSANAGYNLA